MAHAGKLTTTAKAILCAILAAVLYALLTPVSKLLQISVPPVAEAGLLYLGAGLGMAAILAVRKVRGGPTAEGHAAAGGAAPRTDMTSAGAVSSGTLSAGTLSADLRSSGAFSGRLPSLGRSDAGYLIAMVALDMAAPIFLLLGLARSTPESVSLLNNFEIVATACVAAVFFREKISRRLAAAIAVITCSCLMLSLDGASAVTFSRGAVFVLLACVCWGFENNCTSRLSSRDTCQIVLIKGLGSGAGSLIVSRVIGEQLPGPAGCLPVLVLGFLAIGLSVWFYVRAQSRIGAARTCSYYAVAPFLGVLLALLIFRELPGAMFWAALAMMAFGVWLNVRDARIADAGPQ